MKPLEKNRPDRALAFDKEQPLGAYNYPLFSYAEYLITGYRSDAAGIRHPLQWTERLPIGQKVNITVPKGVTVTNCTRTLGGPIQKCRQHAIDVVKV